jgi:hypothetical protein
VGQREKRVREGANVAEREAGILFDAPSLAANATPAAACGSTQDDEVGVSNSKLKKKAQLFLTLPCACSHRSVHCRTAPFTLTQHWHLEDLLAALALHGMRRRAVTGDAWWPCRDCACCARPAHLLSPRSKCCEVRPDALAVFVRQCTLRWLHAHKEGSKTGVLFVVN